jgi:hypothetical protein
MKQPPFPLAAVTVSDRTCEAVFGVPWRSLRQFLLQRGISYQRIGRRPVVRVDAVLMELEKLAGHGWTDRDIEAAIGEGDRRLPAPVAHSEPWSEEMLLRMIREGEELERRGQQWLASNGSGNSDSIVGDPDLRRQVRRIESRNRRRAKIDQERADKGLPPRRWR